MLRSLSTAISGLRGHQTKLDVAGNNIANVNTVAYKHGVVRFQDIFSQTLQAATAPTGASGGVNPAQVGLGMQISSIDTVHEQGAITSTGQETDLAIEGRGFFIVSDGYRNYFTRDGSFKQDSTGVLVNANGYRLLGWAGEETDTSQPLGEILIPLGEDLIARATENMVFTGNLDAATENDETYSYPTYVYDSLGHRHDLTFKFTKEGDNEWEYSISLDEDENDNSVGTGTLFFNLDGHLNSDSTTISDISFDPGTGAETVSVTLDFSALTQLVSTQLDSGKPGSTAHVSLQDGFEAGELATFDIGATGIVTGTYSNGMIRQIAQVAMATFINPGAYKDGLQSLQFYPNSGDPNRCPRHRWARRISRALRCPMWTWQRIYGAYYRQPWFPSQHAVISTLTRCLELINVKR